MAIEEVLYYQMDLPEDRVMTELVEPLISNAGLPRELEKENRFHINLGYLLYSIAYSESMDCLVAEGELYNFEQQSPDHFHRFLSHHVIGGQRTGMSEINWQPREMGPIIAYVKKYDGAEREEFFLGMDEFDIPSYRKGIALAFDNACSEEMTSDEKRFTLFFFKRLQDICKESKIPYMITARHKNGEL